MKTTEPSCFRYRCAACGFVDEAVPLDDDPDKNDLEQLMRDACAALERHAGGREDHLRLLVCIDRVPGTYTIQVNPRDRWKGEGVKRA